MTSQGTTLVTFADIAILTRVQRAVVVAWRTRSLGTQLPFPSAAVRLGGDELFALPEVVDWLEATGSGANPQVRKDAAMITALDALEPEQRPPTVDGLLALLALKAVLGTQVSGRGPAGVFRLADEVDPQDRCLRRELIALGDDVTVWAEHADAVASGTFTPAAAVTCLLGQRGRLGLTLEMQTAVSPTAAALVARLVTQVVPTSTSPFVDPTGAGDLLAAVAHLLGEPGRILLPVLDTAEARRARRVLLATGWEVQEAELERGLLQPPDDATIVAHLPCATFPDLTTLEVIATVGSIASTLPRDSWAVVLGAAEALDDALAPAEQAARRDVLRSGRVFSVIGLPGDLWPAFPGRRLALWVLGPSKPAPLEHRVVAIADLRDHRLDASTVDDLLADAAAMATPSAGAEADRLRLIRLVPTLAAAATTGRLTRTA